jgi:hypothetical protein
MRVEVAEPFEDHRMQVGKRTEHGFDVRRDAGRTGARHAAVRARRDDRVEHARERGALAGREIAKGGRRIAHQSKRVARFFFMVSAM